jgi:hypothetical protein
VVGEARAVVAQRTGGRCVKVTGVLAADAEFGVAEGRVGTTR